MSDNMETGDGSTGDEVEDAVSAAREQYSQEIARLNSKFGGGTVAAQYRTRSGNKYGPYAYHVAPPSEDREWTYLGPVDVASGSSGSSTDHTESNSTSLIDRIDSVVKDEADVEIPENGDYLIVSDSVKEKDGLRYIAEGEVVTDGERAVIINGKAGLVSEDVTETPENVKIAGEYEDGVIMDDSEIVLEPSRSQERDAVKISGNMFDGAVIKGLDYDDMSLIKETDYDVVQYDPNTIGAAADWGIEATPESIEQVVETLNDEGIPVQLGVAPSIDQISGSSDSSQESQSQDIEVDDLRINDIDKSGSGETQTIEVVFTVEGDDEERVYQFRNAFDAGSTFKRIDDPDAEVYDADISQIKEDDDIPTTIMMDATQDYRVNKSADGDSKQDLLEEHKIRRRNDYVIDTSDIDDSTEWLKRVKKYDTRAKHDYVGNWVNDDKIGVDEDDVQYYQTENGFFKIEDGEVQEISESDIQSEVGVEVSDAQEKVLESNYVTYENEDGEVEVVSVEIVNASTRARGKKIGKSPGEAENASLSLDTDIVVINGTELSYDDVETWNSLDEESVFSPEIDGDNQDEIEEQLDVGDEIEIVSDVDRHDGQVREISKVKESRGNTKYELSGGYGRESLTLRDSGTKASIENGSASVDAIRLKDYTRKDVSGEKLSDDTLDKKNADIKSKKVVSTNYGEKLVVKSPFEAKDDIKDLDWEYVFTPRTKQLAQPERVTPYRCPGRHA